VTKSFGFGDVNPSNQGEEEKKGLGQKEQNLVSGEN
jgi:hypothetical protein